MPRRKRVPLSQINVRVPLEVEEILEAAVFVSRSRSIQQLLAPVVEAHAEKLAEDESVQAALRARRGEGAPAS